MGFYNKILKCYVLIDLKIGSMKLEYAGQMNMYLNYYNTDTYYIPNKELLISEVEKILDN